MNYSRNIADYHDIGLTADWSVSSYHIAGNMFVTDDEDGNFSLVHRKNDGPCNPIYTAVDRWLGTPEYAFAMCVNRLYWMETREGFNPKTGKFPRKHR